MESKDLQELGTPEFWNKRYQNATPADKDQASHEWFRSFAQLRPFFEKQLPGPHTNPRILHLGCGDSTLPIDFQKLGYQNQLAVDFSTVVIEQMRRRHAELEWAVGDVRSLEIGDKPIDIAIDKGTMDAMLHGSLWDPPDDVRENVQRYVDEVLRILRPGGRWFYITFRQPHFVKPQLLRDGVWDVDVQRLEDAPGTFEYYAYVMTKK